jgi:dienelactone hydrolase
MRTRDLDYRRDEVNLRGYLAWNDDAAGPRPGVLVFHEGLGLGEFAMERARRLADLGYVALAADMFGDRRQATNLQEIATRAGGLFDEVFAEGTNRA